MQSSDSIHFITQPGEQIRVHTCVDKRPFLCGFSDPQGSSWQNQAATDLCDDRLFAMPAVSGATVVFQATFDAQIADDDPDPKATYRVAISGSSGGNSVSSVVVPKGVFPVPRMFAFTVT